MGSAFDDFQEHVLETLTAQAIEEGCIICGKPLGYYEESPALEWVAMSPFISGVAHSDCAKMLDSK